MDCATASNACNLECSHNAHEWGNTECESKGNQTETYLCNCLVGPRWIEKTVFMIFAGFTLPSLLFPEMIPLARPATAMVGALLTTGVRHFGRVQWLKHQTGPDYSFISWSHAIEMPTIMLLFSLMLISGFMEQIGTFQALATLIRAPTPWRTMLNLSLVSALLSAVRVP